MSGLLNQVINGFPEACQTQSCHRQGCTAHLGNVPNPHCIINMDDPSLRLQNRRHCDFIIFHGVPNGVRAVALELKSGRNVRSAVDQLDETARYLQQKFPAPMVLSEFCAVLVHGKGIRGPWNRDLAAAKLNFRGTQVTIKRMKCNDPANPLFRAKSSLCDLDG